MYTVFISYSSTDLAWRDRIEPYLKTLEARGHYEIWFDADMEAGVDWRQQIDKALKTANLAILLVSQSYLSSRFVKEKELDAFRRRAAIDNDGPPRLRIYPILLSPCIWGDIDWLRDEQWRPKDRMSLEEIKDQKGDSAWRKSMVYMTQEILAILADLDRPAAQRPPKPLPPIPSSAGAQTAVDLRIEHFDLDRYRIEVTFSQSAEDANNFRQSFFFRLKLSTLISLRGELLDHGEQLRECFFRDQSFSACLRDVRQYADRNHQDLIVRLMVDPNARELHSVAWELLGFGEPKSNPLLSTDGAHPILNRYVSGHGESWSEVDLRPKAQLHLLIAVGACDPDKAGLARIHADDETRWLDETLTDTNGGFLAPIEELAQLPGVATPEGLREQLALCKNDTILYLVCHQVVSDEQPALLLHDAAGEHCKTVCADTLADTLADLPMRPRLLVLVPPRVGERLCGQTHYSRAASVLVQAGIAGALTLQGEIGAASWARFLQRFFSELEASGQMDLAAHSARKGLEYKEAIAPALFTRVKTGRIWYKPGFLLNGQDPEVIWDLIIDSIRDRKSTPIIGPAISQALSRSRRRISQLLAKRHLYPMALHGRQSLAQVAQYIAVDKARVYPREEYSTQVRKYVLERFGDRLTNNEKSRYSLDPQKEKKLGPGEAERLTADLVELVGARLMKEQPCEPHMVLAKLNLPLYISANWNRLLSVALEIETKQRPIEYFFGPEDALVEQQPPQATTASESSTKVFYAFGLFGQDSHLVLTEDDYMDFLLSFSRRRMEKTIPVRVLEAMNNSGLLFLGFRMDDWDFRVLFRIISSLEGSDARRGMTHVAVQVNPDDDYIMNPERTRRYLSKYFEGFQGKPAIYWGTAEDFLCELAKRMEI